MACEVLGDVGGWKFRDYGNEKAYRQIKLQIPGRMYLKRLCKHAVDLEASISKEGSSIRSGAGILHVISNTTSNADTSRSDAAVGCRHALPVKAIDRNNEILCNFRL